MESTAKYLARIIPSLFVADKKCPYLNSEVIDDLVYKGCEVNVSSTEGSKYEPCNCSDHLNCLLYNKRR